MFSMQMELRCRMRRGQRSALSLPIKIETPNDRASAYKDAAKRALANPAGFASGI
jgi:hypothetical protein